LKPEFSDFEWFFVTDFSESIGYGHLRRCEILAKKLESLGGKVTFLFRNPELTHSKFEYRCIPTSSDLKDLGQNNRILIVDDHGFNRQYLDALDPFCLVVGLDELGEMREEFDLHFVSTLLGVSPREQRIGKCQEWIGIKWFVFDDEEESPPVLEPGKIPVSFGGSDPFGLTEILLPYLVSLPVDVNRFLIFLGPGFSLDRQTALKSRYPMFDFRAGITDLRPYFRGSDFVIASGGITAYEVLKCGSVPLLIAQHEEQAGVIKELSDKGLAVNLGIQDNFYKMCLKEHIFMQNHDAMRVEFQRRFSQYEAGQGAYAILRQVLEHAKHRSVS